MINALDTPVEAAWRELQAAQDAAAAVPARIRLGETAPDMVRLEAEVKQITHAIRMAAYNAETTLARALDGHYARAGDEAYALIREPSPPPATSALVMAAPHPGSTRSPRPGGPRPGRPLRPAQPDPGLLPRHRSRPALRDQTPSWHCMKPAPCQEPETRPGEHAAGTPTDYSKTVQRSSAARLRSAVMVAPSWPRRGPRLLPGPGVLFRRAVMPAGDKDGPYRRVVASTNFHVK